MNKKFLVGVGMLFLMTVATGCSQVHFGKDAVTIGKQERATSAVKVKKTLSHDKKIRQKKVTKKKIPKKVVAAKWDVQKTQKLKRAINQWEKQMGQTYHFYTGKSAVKTKNGPIYPNALKQHKFLLNKKVINIGYSPLGKAKYQYNVVAIANDNFKTWHNTYLFCLVKGKTVILLDQSKDSSPVMVKLVKDKKLNEVFSKIYNEK